MSALSAPLNPPRIPGMRLSEPGLELYDSGEVVEVANITSAMLNKHAVPVPFTNFSGDLIYVDNDGNICPYYHEVDSSFKYDWVQIEQIGNNGGHILRLIQPLSMLAPLGKDDINRLLFLETFSANGGTGFDYGAGSWNVSIGGTGTATYSVSGGYLFVYAYRTGTDASNIRVYFTLKSVPTLPICVRVSAYSSQSALGGAYVNGVTRVGHSETVGYYKTYNTGYPQVNGSNFGPYSGGQSVYDVGRFNDLVYVRKDDGAWSTASLSQVWTQPSVYAYAYGQGEYVDVRSRIYVYWMFIRSFCYPEPTVLLMRR